MEGRANFSNSMHDWKAWDPQTHRQNMSCHMYHGELPEVSPHEGGRPVTPELPRHTHRHRGRDHCVSPLPNGQPLSGALPSMTPLKEGTLPHAPFNRGGFTPYYFPENICYGTVCRASAAPVVWRQSQPWRPLPRDTAQCQAARRQHTY